MKGVPYIHVQGTPVELEEILPDLSGIKQIQPDELSIETKLGEVNNHSSFFLSSANKKKGRFWSGIQRNITRARRNNPSGSKGNQNTRSRCQRVL